ncbi:HAD hydrolase-like protein [Undibacterium cyanobacteriorum]|uniref:phosphoglycolate phosphatase n=1 Tax=Undibacterium cyanobacteriorum TaxID=3073561 RepID=A0ABY9RJZ8_9BURK|nr:HAD hydrolase-like protein [Undibacterium sp. 20NA77.5]WMW80590.1 HAD hydrolase-like protein [Undibacterium sp. 20NA77.5]
MAHAFPNRDKLILFDADGTIIDAFNAIETTFAAHGMDIGELEAFQKRRKLFKYVGGLKEFPLNIKKQLGKKSRQKVLTTLTEVYREQASLYPGMVDLLQQVLAHKNIRVGLVTRNVSLDPQETMTQLFARHGIDLRSFDLFAHVPMRESKAKYFQQAREQFQINPARSFACGDEHKDYQSALTAGMHPLVVSYGFEDYQRLTEKFFIPEIVIARTPSEMCARVRHSLDLE